MSIHIFQKSFRKVAAEPHIKKMRLPCPNNSVRDVSFVLRFLDDLSIICIENIRGGDICTSIRKTRLITDDKGQTS